MEMILKDIYVQPDVMDEVWNDQLVLEIVSEFVPSASVVTSVDETGGEARTYFVDDNIILKTQRPNRLRPRTSLEKEVFMLREIEKQCDINVPRVLGYTKRNNLVECTVMTRMPGDAIIRTEISESALAEALFIHGKALKTLHSLNQKPFIESGLFPYDKTSDNVKHRFLYRLNLMLDALVKQTQPSELENARNLGREIIAQIPEHLEQVALHSNPYKEHTFINDDKTYSGIIDFGDAYMSHPVNDMRRWNFNERRHLLSGYTSIGTIGDDFMPMWHINYQIDAMLDILKKKGTLLEIGSKNDLLKWE